MSPTFKPLLRLALLVSAVVVIAPSPALGAAAGKKDTVPCWKRLMNDWDDGTINNTYPPSCYTAAIKNMPTELKIYSSAKDDIERALQAVLAHKPIPPESSPPPVTTPTTTTLPTPSGGTGTGPTTTVPAKKHGFQGILADLNPSSSQAFPLPLLILGALAILLVAAGGIGMLWQRSHPRDEPPAAA